ncbi:MAG: sigma-70 family RNA polymerase sigma factor [Spirochaetia bacterium]|nr:sigma-70 family RNA polymerase sigma factor [Spirochaetia bacterium]
MADSKEEIYKIWEEIYRNESGLLYGFLLKKTNEENAQDIMQESFIRLLNAMKKNSKIENTKAYLFQIARNIIIDESRKKIHSIEDSVSNAEYIVNNSNIISGRNNQKTTEDEIIKNELLENVNEALKNLSDEEREIFELRWDFGMKHNEIANILKKSDRQIRRDIDKIVKKIREFFITKGYKIEDVLEIG